MDRVFQSLTLNASEVDYVVCDVYAVERLERAAYGLVMATVGFSMALCMLMLVLIVMINRVSTAVVALRAETRSVDENRTARKTLLVGKTKARKSERTKRSWTRCECFSPNCSLKKEYTRSHTRLALHTPPDPLAVFQPRPLLRALSTT